MTEDMKLKLDYLLTVMGAIVNKSREYGLSTIASHHRLTRVYHEGLLDRTEEQLLNGRDLCDVPDDEKIRFLIGEMQRVLEVEETAKWF